MNPNKESILSISWGAVFKILLTVVFVYILFIVKDILIWFIFALIISILFNFVIDALEKKRVPRLLSAVVLYFFVFALLGFFVYKTAPILLTEFRDLAKSFPEYVQKVVPLLGRLGINFEASNLQNTDLIIQTLQNNLSRASSSMINALFAIFGGATSTVLVLAMAFFISVERKFIERALGALSPNKSKEHLFSLWRRAKKKVSSWFITRIIGVLFVGSATYLVLTVLNVKYAFILSLIAGLFDIVPIIGPAVAGVILFAVVALSSVLQAVFAGGAFIIIQQLEGNLLFPLLFRKLSGLSPVLVLLALAIGGTLWGIAGAVLAIPLAGVVFEIFKDYLARLRRQEKALENL